MSPNPMKNRFSMRFTVAKTENTSTVSFALSELVRLAKQMDPHIAADVRQYSAYDASVKNIIWVGFDGSVPRSDTDTIRIDISNGSGVITASNECAVLIAVYRFMYELGCRFLRPGADGEKIPRRTLTPEALNVQVQETASYGNRAVCIEGSAGYEHIYNMIDWLPKVGMNSYFIQSFSPVAVFRRYYRRFYDDPRDRDYGNIISDEESIFIRDELEAEILKRGLQFQAVGHGWTCEPFGVRRSNWTPDDPIPDSYYPLIAEVNGKRAIYINPAFTNLCYSSPIVRKKMSDDVASYCEQHPSFSHVHFWLSDSVNQQCECEGCRKKRPSDFYIMMLNEIDKKLTAKNVRTKIVFLLYLDLLWAPETEKLNNPDRFILMFAPISRTYSTAFSEFDHSVKYELSPFERNKLVMPKNVGENIVALKQWQESQPPTDSFLFDYHLMWDHHTDPGYYSVAKTLQKDMAELDQLNLNGMVSCQLQRAAFPTALPEYCMAATLWNKYRTFEELADEYFTAAFGDDGKAVKAYLAELSELFDPAYVRGDKECAPEEIIAQYTKAKDVISAFKKTHINIKRTLSADWDYLYYHADIATIFADVYITFLRGETAQCLEKQREFDAYISDTAPYTDSVLDDLYICSDLRKYLRLHKGPIAD